MKFYKKHEQILAGNFVKANSAILAKTLFSPYGLLGKGVLFFQIHNYLQYEKLYATGFKEIVSLTDKHSLLGFQKTVKAR